MIVLLTLALASASVVKHEPMRQPWKEITLPTQLAHSSGRFKRDNEKGTIACDLPSGKPGVCKPLGQCGSDEDNRISFQVYYDLLCMLDEMTPGTCCQDNIEIQTTPYSSGTIDPPATVSTEINSSCNLKDGTPGICKPKGQCGSNGNSQKKFEIYYELLCMLDEKTEGTCCPVSIDVQTTPYSSGVTEELPSTISKENNASCNLNDGTSGICKPQGQCGSNNGNETNFRNYYDSLCMLDEMTPGTCCPDKIEVQTTPYSSGWTVDPPATVSKENNGSCNLNDGTSGICKPQGQCGSNNGNETNYRNYYDSLCMLDEMTPGTCCPDKIEVQTTPNSSGWTVDPPSTISKENNGSCTLNDGTSGICKPHGQCGSNNGNETNFRNYYDSLCMLDEMTPGTCCPDKIEVQTTPYSSGWTVDPPASVSKENNGSCNLNDGTSGICKPQGQCGSNNGNQTNFRNYYDSLCMLDEMTPGTCCPDKIEVQTTPNSSGWTVDPPATVSKETNGSCNLNDGTSGICMPQGQCGSNKGNETNFKNFYDSLCMLNDTTPGTCCPDKIEVQERWNLDTSTGDRPNAACKEESNDSCDLPDGTPGTCKPMLQCASDEDIKENIPKFLRSLCVIGNTKRIGTCCPDGGKAFGADSLAVNLPATASKDESKDILLKIDKAENRGCGLSTRPRDQLARSALGFHTWPWMASISVIGGMKHYCGGVLITDRHILTAAHCLNDHEPKDFKVRLGEYDFSMQNESRTYTFDVVEVIQHEEYDKMIKWNDIAILKLHRPAAFNTYVWPVCLPFPGLELVNETAMLTGWGTVKFGAPMSNVLKEVEMPIWDHQQCAQNFVDTIFEENYCVGAYTGGKDACQFDSGGPLMYNMPSGRWVAIGVVSWGLRCGEPNHPGIYTRTDKYLDWIARQIS